MGTKKVKQRNEIDARYKWNIEDMYSDEAIWEKDLNTSVELAKEFAQLAGKVTESSDNLLKAFTLRDDIYLNAEKAYVYARMRRDEDNRDDKYQAMTDKCISVLAQISSLMSFFTPELLSASDEKILAFVDSEPKLEIYRFAITDTLREKKHILSAQEENLLAQMSEITGATGDIFTMLNNADIKFGTITDEDGDEVELTHGNYIKFMHSYKDEVRKEAFEHMYEAYKKQLNTIGTTYSYNVKTDVVQSRIRKFESARAAALSGDNIDGSVYDNLVSVVNDNLPALHRYIELRKKILGKDHLNMWDVYVPLIKLPKKTYTFEDAKAIINEALAPLGQEYLDAMNKGLESRWVDVYENEGKTSGAYSFGSYNSMPYILMNFSGTLEDVFTLIHEMGHSMHSYYTRKNQPFIYGSHSIFTAEVASTVNEALLMNYLINKETDKEVLKYLINMYIEAFRTTLFRQTMFAEFEDLTHKTVESGQTITAQWMSDEYEKLNSNYFGPAVEKDDYIRYEWARIPHFYSAFYVYKYATGYSAATAIASGILGGKPEAAQNYIEFLKTGESNYPIELLKIAGVDMGSPEPIKAAMVKFKELVDRFENLLS